MVKQEHFHVERWMDTYETKVELNIAETCCASLSIEQIEQISGTVFPFNVLKSQRLVYGAIPGSDALRSTVASIYNETNQQPRNEADKSPLVMSKDNVLISNGAIGANFLVYYALAGPGDQVIVVDPAYQQLKSVPKMFGAHVDILGLRAENGFLPDLDELRQIIKNRPSNVSRTKLIVVNSPHNPSGSVIDEAMLKDLITIARNEDAYLMFDEVYRPLFHSLDECPEAEQFSFSRSVPSCVPPSVVSLYEKGISTGSTSKAFGMAGVRVGWIVSPCTEVLQECMSRRDYNTISVSLVDDAIASWALGSWRNILDHNMALCRNNLRQIVDPFVAKCRSKVSLVRPKAGTTMFLKINQVADTETFCAEFIKKHNTLIVPGESFGCPGYVRIGFANSSEELKEGLDRLALFINEWEQ